MREKKINAGNFSSIEWDDNYFIFCYFEGFANDGGIISSDFINCSFSNIDWYWGIFTLANFIDCKFENCTFRGTDFSDSKFIKCKLSNCNFVKDNLKGDCDFLGAIAFGCQVTNCKGFNL